MEINLVVLNVGNSRLALAPFVAGEIGAVTRVPLDQPDQWERHVRQAWEQVRLRDNAAVVAASVNRRGTRGRGGRGSVADRARRLGREGFGASDPRQDREAEETGVDRVLNVAGGLRAVGNACVVVDAGTAVRWTSATTPASSSRRHTAGRPHAARRASREDGEAAPGGVRPAQGARRPQHQRGDAPRRLPRIRGTVKELAENYATERAAGRDHCHGGRRGEVVRRLGTDPRDLAGPDPVRRRAGVRGTHT